MTPKETAIELAEKMYSNANSDMGMDWYEALACAKTAVDEIIKVLKEEYWNDDYWQEVKIEIEKL